MKRFILFALACMVLAVPLALHATPDTQLVIVGSLLTVNAFLTTPISYNLGSSINTTELATNLGAYYREHRDLLIAETLLSEDFSSRYEVMNDVGDELPLPNLEISDIVKPADSVNFTPTSNALAFGSRNLKVRGMKVDLLLIPEVLQKTWLGRMKKAQDVMDMPFEAFIMDYIAQKVRENIWTKALYLGVYNASGTTPGATMNGWNKIIADEITATNITPVVTGATTSTNIIDHIEAVYDAIGEAYKNGTGEIKVKPRFFDWYNRRNRSLHGAHNNYEGMKMGRIPLDGTSWEIVRDPGLGSSNRIIATPKVNQVLGVSSDSMTFDFQKFDRSVKVLGDFKAGVDFKEIHARSLSVNDQA
ncbi:MAG: hypothetical protein C0424_10360 [Sphingobacteriaceae bacterium]|nr:hypothetical protein [Sphingobacteriaceae bacterium]